MLGFDGCLAQSSRLAVFGGRGISFKIWRGTLGSLAMLAAIRRVCRLSLPLQSLKKGNSVLTNWLLFDRHECSDKSGAFTGS